jgi:deoxyadenosine/deoxycytidine kinase
MARIISIDGNIGAGKSTVLDALEARLKADGRTDVYVLREPVDRWIALQLGALSLTAHNDGRVGSASPTNRGFASRILAKLVHELPPTEGSGAIELAADSGGENLLQLFYRDPAKYAFVFQVHIFHTFIAELDRVRRDFPRVRTIVCERSIASSRHVFAHMLRDAGHLSAVEFAVYEAMFDCVDDAAYPQHIVYIDVPVDTCLARIRRRDREGEDGITEAYLNQCEYRYHHCIQKMYQTHPAQITWVDGDPKKKGSDTKTIMSRIMDHL